MMALRSRPTRRLSLPNPRTAGPIPSRRRPPHPPAAPARQPSPPSSPPSSSPSSSRRSSASSPSWRRALSLLPIRHSARCGSAAQAAASRRQPQQSSVTCRAWQTSYCLRIVAVRQRGGTPLQCAPGSVEMGCAPTLLPLSRSLSLYTRTSSSAVCPLSSLAFSLLPCVSAPPTPRPAPATRGVVTL